MKENFENINLNLFNPNVIDNFDVVKSLNDNSVILLKYEDNSQPKVNFKKATWGYDSNQVVRYFVDVDLPNKELDSLVIICRTSVNLYKVTFTDFKNTYIQNFKNINEISNFLIEFCKNTLSNVAK